MTVTAFGGLLQHKIRHQKGTTVDVLPVDGGMSSNQRQGKGEALRIVGCAALYPPRVLQVIHEEDLGR